MSISCGLCLCQTVRALRIMNISMVVLVRMQLGQCASAASAGPGCASPKAARAVHIMISWLMLVQNKAGGAHHQHQLGCAIARAMRINSISWAVRSIIISWVVLRSRTVQCRPRASSASFGLCSGRDHHEHQLGCVCPKAAQSGCIMSISSVLFVQNIAGSAHHQHLLGCFYPNATRAICISSLWAGRIISISRVVLVRMQMRNHQHQMGCAGPGTNRAERIISISWVVVVCLQPGQCASAASVGLCLSECIQGQWE